MRRILVAVAVLGLAACGQPTQETNETPAVSTVVTAPTTNTVEDAAEAQAEIAELPAPYNQANYEAGRRVFAQCRSCHTIGAGEPNRVGPNLHGVFGREIGSVAGFNYSPAVQGADFVWTAEQLNTWLQSPQTFLPGNRMAFAGVRNETQRRDLIAYLMVEAKPEE